MFSTQTTFSKPPDDVALHTTRLAANNAALLERQRRIAGALTGRPGRGSCLLCSAPVASAVRFSHRNVPYLVCGSCGHVQCALLAPAGYPYSEQDFADIYAPLGATAYADRTARIYQPKLRWALDAAHAAGLGDLTKRRWIELGSGAGHFIDALRATGVCNIGGLEAEQPLVSQAAAALGAPLVQHFDGSLAQAIEGHPADVYAAWFVLEHCVELPAVLSALGRRPSGTVFVFSVPTFGLAALLELVFAVHYARSLDSVLHVQMFTDRSIRHAMDLAGYDVAAEWIFGQDADDLYRAVAVQASAAGALPALQAELDRLLAALPAVQEAVDRSRLADARHVLAVRR
jgi:hypothetical protein